MSSEVGSRGPWRRRERERLGRAELQDPGGGGVRAGLTGELAEDSGVLASWWAMLLTEAETRGWELPVELLDRGWAQSQDPFWAGWPLLPPRQEWALC